MSSVSTAKTGKNTLFSGLQSIVSCLCGLVSAPYLSRVLGIENYGKVYFGYSVINLFSCLAMLGITTYAVREGVLIRDDKKKLGAFAGEMLVINAIAAIFSTVLLWICILSIPKFADNKWIIILLAYPIFTQLFNMDWIFWIYEKYVYTSVRTMLTGISTIVLILIFVNKPEDYLIYGAIMTLCNVAGALASTITAFCQNKISFHISTSILKHVRPVALIFAYIFSSKIYTLMDSFILGLTTEYYYVGLYTNDVLIYTTLDVVLGTILTVSFPILSAMYGTGDTEGYKKRFSELFQMEMVILLPTITGFFCLANPIITSIFGIEYAPAARSLKVLVLALFFRLLVWLFNNSGLIVVKLDNRVFQITMFSAVLNTVLNIFLIPRYQDYAAAWTTFASEIVMALGCFYFFRPFIKGISFNKDMWTTIPGCMLIAIYCTYIKKVVSWDIMVVLAGVLGSIVIYALFQLIVKNTGMRLFIELFTKHKEING